MNQLEKVNVAEKLKLITKPWSHGIVGQVNDTHIKVVKLEGEFVWHRHAKEDELFYVVEGELIMHFRDKTVTVMPGEFIVVPRQVDHKPEAPVMTSILLIEPATTVNTGDALPEERTHDPVWI
jgi:mannose-6-phosphate isomerase-like protein (cupin superfamily)